MQVHTERFEQFSDGVFAIAITLLALELKVPLLKSPGLQEALRDLWPLIPSILTFFLSFITIAIFWVNHRQLTQVLSTMHRRILWANILVLFFVTLIPFVTTAASVNPFHPLAVLTYSLILLGGSLSFSMLRYFIHQSCGEGHIPMKRSMVGPLFYTLAVIASFYSIWIAYLMLAIPPLFYFLPRSSTPSSQ
jgi:uncharacterized membrane protein